MKKVAVIGAGNMGNAIIKGIKGRYKVIASDYDKSKLAKLKVSTTTDNVEAVKNSEIIILAVKPQSMDSVLNDIKHAVNPKHLVISIAAGIKTKKIENILGNIPVIRVMPNTPMLVGLGMSVICAGRFAKNKHMEVAEKIFASMGKVIHIKDETKMDAVTAISGSGPAYVYLFIESLVKAGIKLGLNKSDAETLVLQTFKGAVMLLEKSGKTPLELRKHVTSPGGTTEAALRVFEDKIFHEIVHLAVKSAHRRSKELSK